MAEVMRPRPQVACGNGVARLLAKGYVRLPEAFAFPPCGLYWKQMVVERLRLANVPNDVLFRIGGAPKALEISVGNGVSCH